MYSTPQPSTEPSTATLTARRGLTASRPRVTEWSNPARENTENPAVARIAVRFRPEKSNWRASSTPPGTRTNTTTSSTTITATVQNSITSSSFADSLTSRSDSQMTATATTADRVPRVAALSGTPNLRSQAVR